MVTNDRRLFGMRTNDLLVARDRQLTTDVFLCYNISAYDASFDFPKDYIISPYFCGQEPHPTFCKYHRFVAATI